MGGEDGVRGAEKEVDKETKGEREIEKERETSICIFIYKYVEIGGQSVAESDVVR